jgi:membrane protein YdbS with pleckstrin-like domain
VADELLYNVDSGIIIVTLFVALIAALEIGSRLGRKARTQIDDAGKSQAGSLQGAIIGLLALLLAFTLSMAINRYDARRQLVLDEANSIGTTYLRAKLLPTPYAVDVQNLLRQYVTNRLNFFNAGVDQARIKAADDQATQLQQQLWSIATTVSAQDNRSVPIGLFVQALNDTIDLQAKRLAAFNNRVPETVIWLLLGVSVVAAGIVGYNNGLGNRRHVFGAIALVVLLVVIIWAIIDLDRPRRGLIQISQQSMIDVQDFITHDLP